MSIKVQLQSSKIFFKNKYSKPISFVKSIFLFCYYSNIKILNFVKILQYLYRKRTIHSILLDVLQSLFKCKLALTAFEIKQNIFHPSKITASDVEKIYQLFI